MQKYGDFSQKTTSTSEIYRERISSHSSHYESINFNSLWNLLVPSSSKPLPLNVWESFYSAAEIPYTPIKVPDVSSHDQFINLLKYYSEELPYLKEDVALCVCYRLGFDNKKQLFKKQLPKNNPSLNSFCDRLDRLEVDSSLYNLPFSFNHNTLYTDFCSYTWSVLCKDSHAPDLFRKINLNISRANTNTTGLNAIKNKFKPYTDPLLPPLKITPNDIWLVEKITGFSLTLSIAFLLIKPSKALELEDIKKLIPIINTLVLCKPIEMRLALSDLTISYIKNVLIQTDSDETFDSKAIADLQKILEESITTINNAYTQLVDAIYDTYKTKKNSYFELEAYCKDIFASKMIFWDVKKKEIDVEEYCRFDLPVLQQYKYYLFINKRYLQNNYNIFKTNKKRAASKTTSKTASKTASKTEKNIFAYLQAHIISEIFKSYE